MMRCFFTLLMALVAIQSTAFAQDLLTLKTGEVLQTKIQEITPQEIKYKAFDNLGGPVYTIPKHNATSVRYESGKTESFAESTATAPTDTAIIAAVVPTPTPTTAVSTPTPPTDVPGAYAAIYVRGANDAKVYYRGYKGAGTGTLLTTMLLNPLLGLIPAIATSATPPKKHNLGYPDYQLGQNKDYHTGYGQEARRIKSRKVWSNFGIGTGLYLVIILLANAAGN
jgi:hypothetical protein